MYKMYGVIGKPLRATPPSKLTPIEYHDLDDILGAAQNLNARGGTALLIEGDDGTRLDRFEIVQIARERGARLQRRPKVY